MTVRPLTFAQSTVALFDAKKDAVCKVISYGIDWLRFYEVVERTQKVAKVREFADTTKLMAGAVYGIPGKVYDIYLATVVVYDKRSMQSLKNLGWKLNSITNNLMDALELVSKHGVVTVPEKAYQLAEKINAVSMFATWGKNVLFFGKLVPGAIEDLRYNMNAAAAKHKLIECAKAISYLVLASLLIASAFLGVMLHPMAIKAASSAALVCTIAGFYNEQMNLDSAWYFSRA